MQQGCQVFAPPAHNIFYGNVSYQRAAIRSAYGSAGPPGGASWLQAGHVLPQKPLFQRLFYPRAASRSTTGPPGGAPPAPGPARAAAAPPAARRRRLPAAAETPPATLPPAAGFCISYHATRSRQDCFTAPARLAESAPLQPLLERRQLRRLQRRRHAGRATYNGGLQPQAMLRNTSWQVISTGALYVCCRLEAGYAQPLPAAAPLRRRPPRGPPQRRPWPRPRVPAGLLRSVAAAPARPTTLCIGCPNSELLQNSQYCTYDCGTY